jgi:hypothetical protein
MITYLIIHILSAFLAWKIWINKLGQITLLELLVTGLVPYFVFIARLSEMNISDPVIYRKRNED